MITRSRVALLFYIKRTKLHQNGEAPIFLKIKVDKQSAEFSIMKSVAPALWSVEKNGAAGSTKEAKEVNNYINLIRHQVNEHLSAMRDNGCAITAKNLKNAFLGIKTDEKSIVSVFEDHNQSVTKLVGKDFAAATLQRYQTCLKHLKDYIKEKYKENDLPLEKLDTEFIRGFEFYLKTERNCAHNTTMKYIKNFKKIIRICFGNGWIKQDPFINIKLKLNKVDKGFLSEDELSTIINKKFSCVRIQQVADVFLFGCFTGYAYSDLKKLSPENVVKDANGQLWIHTRRIKTDNVSHVPLLPIAQQIIDKYSNHSYCIKKNVLLPVLSNQKLNAYLKEIADLCGINKNLSTHIARHTFATTVTLNNDIPIETVSKMLGHSSVKMTETYARMLDKKVGNDMNKIMDKFAGKAKIPYFESCIN